MKSLTDMVTGRWVDGGLVIGYGWAELNFWRVE